MRSLRPGPIPCITLIAMLSACAVATLILVLDGAAEYGLAAGVILLSIGVHFRDRRTHERERERARQEGAATEARRLVRRAQAHSDVRRHHYAAD